MAEYSGTIYLPLKNRGLYAYDEKGIYQLISGNINYVRVSPSGEELVYVEDGSLHIYELDSRTSRLLLQASPQEMLETPAWSPDGSRIVFVSKQKSGDGRNNRPGQIAEINRKKGIVAEITIGANPLYISDQKAIIFDNDNNIVSRNLETGQEKVLDFGQSPSISHDGAYIAYIKTEGDQALQDVWVADSDFVNE